MSPMLTLSTLLTLVYEAFLPLYKSQQELFAALYASYHQAISDDLEMIWRTNQGIIAALLSGKRTLPRSMRVYYARQEGHERLRNDMYGFLNDVVATAQQRQELHTQLCRLVSASNNLLVEDQAYILAYHDVQLEYQLHELLTRMMLVSICISKQKTYILPEVPVPVDPGGQSKS